MDTIMNMKNFNELVKSLTRLSFRGEKGTELFFTFLKFNMGQRLHNFALSDVEIELN